jgi:uncharacterized protein (TIGR04255 family)
MPDKLPSKLRKTPLIECHFEVRFEPAKPGAGELLVGLLYSALSDYQKIDVLPLANVPAEYLAADANLRYGPTRQLSSNNNRISVGERVALFTQVSPYAGWDNFRSSCVALLEALRATKLIGNTERYSLKFVNLLSAPNNNRLPLLNAQFEVGGRTASDAGFHFRTEFPSNTNFITIIEIFSGTFAVSAPVSSLREGLLISVDSIRMSAAEDIWASPVIRLNEIHDLLKINFFTLLKAETLASFEPEY